MSYTSDNIPIDIDDCSRNGMSGLCGFKTCNVLIEGECECFDPENYTEKELIYLYDNGLYEDIIKDFLKE